MTNIWQPSSERPLPLPLLALEDAGLLPKLLTTREVAQALRVHPETVERWRRTGGGPRYRRLTGGAIRYTVDDLTEYIEQAANTTTGRQV